MKEFEQLAGQLATINRTLGSGDLTQINKQISSLAQVKVTAEMVAQQRHKLENDKLSNQNLKEWAKLFDERLKILLDNMKIIAECMQKGFKTKGEQFTVCMGVLNSVNSLEQVMAQIGFSADTNQRQANNFIGTFHR